MVKKIFFTSVLPITAIWVNVMFYGCSCTSKSIAHLTESAAPNSLYDQIFPAETNSVFVLQTDMDLGGKIYLIPEGVTIVQKKGLIKNGELIGIGTKLEATNAIFDNVTIKGTWNVRKISTSLFKDLTYSNALRDVMALTNPNVRNEVFIKEGHYLFEAEKSGSKYINVCSNTKLTIDGIIETAPNPYKSYSVVSIEGCNIELSGVGTIKGDKPNHKGIEGEWGMGIYISNASECEISGLTVRDCWGDCIYVGKGSKDITLHNLTLTNGRRQGISITDGENVKIYNTTISDVSGTAPGYAIDIEPNKQSHIRNVTIENVVSTNCDGGFVVSVIHPDVSSVERVSINKCHINDIKKRYSLVLKNCKSITINKSYIDQCSYKYSCLFSKVEDVILIDNVIHTQDMVVNDVSNVTLTGNDVYGNGLYPTNLKNSLTSKQKIKNNRILGAN